MADSQNCDRCGKSVPNYTLNYTMTTRAQGNLCQECVMFAFLGPAPPHQCRTKSATGYMTCDTCSKEMPEAPA